MIIGNKNEISALKTQLVKDAIEEALARILLGNNSESNT